MLEEFERWTKKVKLHISQVDKCFLETPILIESKRKISVVKDSPQHTLDFNYAQAYKPGAVGDIEQGV